MGQDEAVVVLVKECLVVKGVGTRGFALEARRGVGVWEMVAVALMAVSVSVFVAFSVYVSVSLSLSVSFSVSISIIPMISCRFRPRRVRGP